jgi:hypothetical protein
LEALVLALKRVLRVACDFKPIGRIAQFDSSLNSSALMKMNVEMEEAYASC